MKFFQTFKPNFRATGNCRKRSFYFKPWNPLLLKSTFKIIQFLKSYLYRIFISGENTTIPEFVSWLDMEQRWSTCAADNSTSGSNKTRTTSINRSWHECFRKRTSRYMIGSNHNGNFILPGGTNSELHFCYIRIIRICRGSQLANSNNLKWKTNLHL